MSNVIKGKTNSSVDKMENPIELLDVKINDIEKALNEAKVSGAKVIGNAESVKKQIEETQQLIQDYDLSDNDLIDIILGPFRSLFFEWLRRESPYMKKEAPDLLMTYDELSVLIEYLLDEELCCN